MLADDPAACADVVRAIRIQVATAEINQTRFEFRERIERRAASIVADTNVYISALNFGGSSEEILAFTGERS